MNLFQETLCHEHSLVLTVEAVLHRSRTAHQDVLIFENRIFGKVLVLDGIIQLTERDNHLYHEMIAHVPLTANGAAGRVLVIGGGDGGALKEVLKHPVHRAVLVELDRDVIELSRRFFPEVSGGAFDDPRAEVIVRDGARYVAETAETFDVIIVDSTDPIGPGEQLFSDTFYHSCRTLLRPGGIVAVQSGVPFFQPNRLEGVRARLGECFGAARSFMAPVPTYACGMLALIAAGESRDALCPPLAVLRERFTRIRGGTRYYSPEVHGAAFVLAPSFAWPPRHDGSSARCCPEDDLSDPTRRRPGAAGQAWAGSPPGRSWRRSGAGALQVVADGRILPGLLRPRRRSPLFRRSPAGEPGVECLIAHQIPPSPANRSIRSEGAG